MILINEKMSNKDIKKLDLVYILTNVLVEIGKLTQLITLILYNIGGWFTPLHKY